MKLSIIVPVYNAEKYLNRCVDSILNQTFADFELLLIDDGSTDKSGQICDEYAENDSRVKVTHSANQGAATARNTGLDMVAGEYIGFVDADDYIESEMYERLIKAADDNNADVCCCGYYREEIDVIYPKHREDGELVILNGQNDIFREYLRQDYENGFGDGNWNKIFKSEIVRNIRYKDYTNGEDVDFQIEAFKTSRKVACISDDLYHYNCSNNESATKKEFNKRYLGILKVSDDIFDYISEHIHEDKKYAYAFKLTWYMSVLQKIYESDNPKKYIDDEENIRQVIVSDYSMYVKNIYAKRLDKYLACALKYRCVNQALTFRRLVRMIRK